MTNAICEFLTKESDLIAVIIGWFLGLVSAVGAWFAGTFVKRYRFEKTVKAELVEVRWKAASYVFSILSKRGKLDKDALNWCLGQFTKYRKTDERNRMIDNINGMLKAKDEDLATANKIALNASAAEPAHAMPKIYIPFLVSNAESIALVSEKRSVALVQILSHMEILNGKIEDMTYWDRFTFSPGNDGNYDKAVRNSETSKDAIIGACRRICKLLDDALI